MNSKTVKHPPVSPSTPAPAAAANTAGTTAAVSMCGFCGVPCSSHCSHCAKVAYCSREHQKAHRRAHKADCFPAKLAEDPVLGEHLVATRPIAPGEVIFTDQPLLVGPRSNLPPGVAVCLGCHGQLAGLSPSTSNSSSSAQQAYKCSRCKWPVCGRQCEELPCHKNHECPVLAKNCVQPPAGGGAGGGGAHSDEVYTAITALRTLLTRRVDPSRWARLKAARFESHTQARRARSDCMEQLHRVVNFITNQCQVTEFEIANIDLVYGWIVVNGYGDPNTFSVKLYPKASKISNCCLPNTRTLHTNPEKGLQVMATVPIARGSRITQLYGLLLQGTVPRQELFHSIYFFTCSCERCKDPTELGTNFSSVRCSAVTAAATDAGRGRKARTQTQIRRCEGYLLPTPTPSTCPLQEQDKPWKCDTCSKTRSYTKQVAPVVLACSQTPAIAELGGVLYAEYEAYATAKTTTEDAAYLFNARLTHTQARFDLLRDLESNRVHSTHYALLPLKTALVATMHTLLREYLGSGGARQRLPPTFDTQRREQMQPLVGEFKRMVQELLDVMNVLLPGLTLERGILLFYKSQAWRFEAELRSLIAATAAGGGDCRGEVLEHLDTPQTQRQQITDLENEAIHIVLLQPEYDTQRQLVLTCLGVRACAGETGVVVNCEPSTKTAERLI